METGMLRYMMLAMLFNRRKQSMPVPQDRRRPTRKQASDMLHASLDRLQETVTRAMERTEEK